MEEDGELACHGNARTLGPFGDGECLAPGLQRAGPLDAGERRNQPWDFRYLQVVARYLEI